MLGKRNGRSTRHHEPQTERLEIESGSALPSLLIGFIRAKCLI